MKIKTLSVFEVNNYIKKTLENDYILRNLSVKGEISNLKYHSSGHIYFSLKDDNAKVNCVMFKGRACLLKFPLKEGMEVIVNGRASLYPKDGSFQLYCEDITKEGVGELHIKFEELKEKLFKKGYFNEENKKNIPVYPERIGVVTSETGAVIQDIINVTKRRNSKVDIVLYPAKVQGEGGYLTIIDGIKYFNKNKNVDVIIIGRGGGSMEELWNFNEEDLATEIYKSKLPIISAVGHEVDFTISDFVSDLRAATPSQAAELAVPLLDEMYKTIDNYRDGMCKVLENRIGQERNNLNSLNRMLNFSSPLTKIINDYKEIDGIKARLDSVVTNKVNNAKNNLISLNKMLSAYNPINVLNKGYAIIEDVDNKTIKSVEKLLEADEITIMLSDGKVKGNFKSVE